MTQENEKSLSPGGSGSAAAADSRAAIVAKPGRYYRNTRYVMFLLILGFGIACIYDGWVRWPQQNALLQQAMDAQKSADASQNQAEIDRIAAVRAKYKLHTEMDLNIQKGLGIVLPPLAILLLLRSLYLSRGQYRLEDGILHVPGHPPIPIGSITQVDRRLWDRKGILYFNYQVADGSAGKVKLDDFVYDRKATDQIVEHINTGASMKEEG